MKNLGDKIAAVAQPVAKAVDYVFGTDIENCGGCHKMQRNLNAGMPVWDAFYERFFGNQNQVNQQQKENKMLFLIQVAVEADDAREAMAKIPIELPIRSVNPGPPQPQPGRPITGQPVPIR